MTSADLTRRGVLTGAAAIGVASALAACGSEPSIPAGAESGQAGGTRVKMADVPVGSTVIAGNVVVSQPTAGQYRAYSAVCPHQGCLVSKVEGTQIRCVCHESAFSVSDGAVLAGPATRGLVAKTVTVNGDLLTIT